MPKSGSEQSKTSAAEVKAALEDFAVEALFALLRSRGHFIDDVRWPDRERKGAKGLEHLGEKTVDLTFREDGRPVGLDVFELHESQRHARQGEEMLRVVSELEVELRPKVLSLSPGNSIAITWVPTWLPAKSAMNKSLDVMRQTILEQAPRLVPGPGSVDLDPKPDFLEEFRATCYPSLTPSFGFISMHADQTGLVGQAVASMVDGLLKSTKVEQLAAFDDARVLAIDRVVVPFPEDVQDALAARVDEIPTNWSAIYYVMPYRRPALVTEVWRRPTKR